jgi:hypothetical protein
VGSSMHVNAHGEFGVTCRPRAFGVWRRRYRREARRSTAIMKSGPEQGRV